MPAPESVSRLADRFREHLDAYKSGSYNETQLRREFLDPFFVELGWDVFNTQGYAGDYKDVVHEAAIKIGGTTKAPDYSFRIGGQRKFFVEAKKPSVDVKGDPHPAYQLRRYAWTAGLPVSILSDFEEFAVYDCRVKPTPRDKASTARILYMTFEEYEQRWDEIEGVFSKTAILKGAFDKYASKQTRKRGTAEPDEEFLKLLEGWRSALAQNIARNNTLTVRQINHAVQLIIDRIVFLRICEDRGVEVAGTLQGLLNGPKVYERLFERFRHADAKYNSGLFHFHNEAGREAPDTLTPSLEVGDKVLKDIIRNLYYPESPYELSVLPADILGHIYERFLGSVITLSDTGKTAKVEEKPEVRKAGGVYYTPTYIVDYIVEHTVGELLKDRALEPKGRGKARGPAMNKPLRVLDPACGSGSFLLGAYDHLLEWHLRFYTDNDPESWAKLARPPIARKAIPDEKATHSDYKLTTHEKKRILTEHIFGVDIDAQAVEVTKLSLLLKVLEGENEQTLQPLLFAKERALPDLSDNIRCGNSLIGSDFYTGQQGTMFDAEEQYRINAFDWDLAFREIMESGGFEAVIGNPPWGAAFSVPDLKYLKARFSRVVDRMTDSYIYFIDASLQLAGTGGRVGLIVPGTVLNQTDARSVRQLLLEQSLRCVINLGKRVFGPRVLNTSAILIVGGDSPADVLVANLSSIAPVERQAHIQRATPIAVSEWRALVDNDPHRTFFTSNIEGALLLNRLRKELPALSDALEGPIQRGVSPDIAEAHVVKADDIRAWQIEEAALRRSLSAGSIRRYGGCSSDRWIIYTSRESPIDEWPNALAFLSQYREKNTCKEVAQGKHPWWSLHRPRDPAIFQSPKLIGLTTSKTFALVVDRDESLVVTDAAYVMTPKSNQLLEVLLGVMHSRLFIYLYRVANEGEARVIPQIKATKIRHLPIPEFADQPERGRLAELVQSMLDMNERLQGEGGQKLTPQERRVLESRIASTDREIDRLVYDLYGLTDEEIAIVEEATTT